MFSQLAHKLSAGGHDRPDGHYEPHMARPTRATPTTVESLSQAFSSHGPLATAKSTRVEAWRNWRTCLTARGTTPRILPGTTIRSWPCCGLHCHGSLPLHPQHRRCGHLSPL